jgi:hypothetical protein
VKYFRINESQIYRLIGDDSIINHKKIEALESIYSLIGDDSTIDQIIFQAPELEWPNQNSDVNFFYVSKI